MEVTREFHKTLCLLLIFALLILTLTPNGAMQAEERVIDPGSFIYLPVVVRTFNSMDCADDSVNGTLVNDALVETQCGVSLGAFTNTMIDTLKVTISASWVPTLTVALPTQVLGEYYQFSSEDTELPSPDNPFVVAFPVPDGADTSHLALAVLQSFKEIKDVKPSGQSWSYLEGV